VHRPTRKRAMDLVLGRSKQGLIHEVNTSDED